MTWVDDWHVGCSIGDAGDHGWCKPDLKLTCTWCGHLECAQPRDSVWVDGMHSVLQTVAAERARQVGQYGLNEDIEDGTGIEVQWLKPFSDWPAGDVEGGFRKEYEAHEDRNGKPTWVHLVREEVAEAFQEDDPERLAKELIQVAALCVSWVEKIRSRIPQKNS